MNDINIIGLPRRSKDKLSPSNVTSTEKKQLRITMVKTHGLLKESMMLFAIRNNKVQELVRLVEEVTAANNLPYDAITGAIDPTEICKKMFINKHTKASTPGTLTYDVIKWKRTKFILSPHSIVYGNCPKSSKRTVLASA